MVLTVVDGEYTEKISISLSKMCAYVENGNPDLYFAESDSVKKQLTLLKEGEFPSIHEILYENLSYEEALNKEEKE